MTERNENGEQPGRRGVLDAAAALFVERGYAATTLREIAAAAGIKAGSIYHHFDSKEQLFAAVLDDGIAVMIDAFHDAEAEQALDGSEVSRQLLAHVRAHLGALFEHGPYTTAHVTAFFSAPSTIRTAAIELRDRYEELWNGLLETLLPSINAKELRIHRLLLFGAMNSTIEWFDQRGNISLDQVAQHITTQFLHGVSHEAN